MKKASAKEQTQYATFCVRMENDKHIYLLLYQRERDRQREDKPENNELAYLQGVGGRNSMNMGGGLTFLFFIVRVLEACGCSIYSKYKIKSKRMRGKN